MPTDKSPSTGVLGDELLEEQELAIWLFAALFVHRIQLPRLWMITLVIATERWRAG